MKSKRGGARKGAGRKKGEPTSEVRVRVKDAIIDKEGGMPIFRKKLKTLINERFETK